MSASRSLKTATLWQFFFLCTVALTASAANACDRVTGDVSFGSRLLDSEITEFATGGKILVTEKGSLPGTEISASFQCDRWILAVQASSNTGARSYSGQTSLGVPLASVSHVGDHLSGAALYWQITESLQAGLEVSNDHITRDIVGTSTAAGYPEIYDRVTTRIGSKWSIPSAIGTWTLAGAMSVGSDQTMRLTLPGKDSTTLYFDSPSQSEMGVYFRKDLGNSLYLGTSYRHIRTEVSQSRYAVVRSGGVPVGIAYQPKTLFVDQALSVYVGMIF